MHLLPQRHEKRALDTTSQSLYHQYQRWMQHKFPPRFLCNKSLQFVRPIVSLFNVDQCWGMSWCAVSDWDDARDSTKTHTYYQTQTRTPSSLQLRPDLRISPTTLHCIEDLPPLWNCIHTPLQDQPSRYTWIICYSCSNWWICQVLCELQIHKATW